MRTIGIDFGNTITYKAFPEASERLVYPDCFRVIRRMVTAPDTDVYIISKVDDEQKKRAIEWMEKANFYAETGIAPDYVLFCKERHEKGLIADALELTHHIDDRPEVMVHMNSSIRKYLYDPVAADVVTFFNGLSNTRIVKSWRELELEFFPVEQ